MAVSAGFREYVREQMERVAPLSMRAMFGGVGLYSDGVFFALIDDDTVFFKVDERNRADFEAAGMKPFRPFGDDRTSMQYYELPAEVLEDREDLRRWVRGALQAALGKAAGRSARRPPAGEKARGEKRGAVRRAATDASSSHTARARRPGSPAKSGRDRKRR
jgi:DNA transformation protein